MNDHIVRDPDFDAVVRGSFAQQGLMSHLGAQLANVEPGHVEIEVSFRDELTQQHGRFHAGVTAAIADSACGYSALTLMPPGSEVLSIEYKINLLAPARGERLVARGTVVRSGRTISVCRGEVYSVTSDQEEHCATMVATMMRVGDSA